MEYTLVKENNFEKARRKIEQSKKEDKKIIFNSEDDELNRKILEKQKIDILLINVSKRKDKQKERNSGLDEVMAKLAEKNKIEIGINLDEVIESNSLKEKSEIIARIKQNVELCKKNKVGMKFVVQDKKNERDKYDLKSLGTILGMSTIMTKNL